MATGKGYGKIILFGEHFVVYGLPGIASGLDKYVEVEISDIKKNDIVFEDKVFKETISKSSSPGHISCKLFDSLFFDLDINSINITISGNCIPAAGMGYSAALSVALTRAVNEYLSLSWSDSEVSDIAYRGECLIHGKPSGIDNACATFGSLIYFQKDLNTGQSEFKNFAAKNTLLLVIADTGVKHDTREAVAMVAENNKSEPELFKKYFEDAKIVVEQARLVIMNGDIKKVGSLMNRNQELLKNIGVSSPEIENLIAIALDNNALGSKLTGAGCGGLVISLCRDLRQQKQLRKSYEKHNIKAIKASIK